MGDTPEPQALSPTQSIGAGELSVTQHRLMIGARELPYTVTCGTLELHEDVRKDGKSEGRRARAKMFFVAYTLDGAGETAGNSASDRPISFSFNGGPGSSAVWLHLGLLGPKRVELDEEGYAPTPTGKLVPNVFSLLDASDLVFIDPIGTGFSQVVDGENVAEFHDYQRDIESIGEFVRLYCSRYSRWGSPKYLIGESYGSLRAAALANHLLERHGMYLHGLMLISCVLDYQHVQFDPGNDLPCILFLPTYAAIAWFHRLLAPELQRPLPELLNDVQAFAGTDYARALFLGAKLEPETRETVVATLARYTGLSAAYIERTNLRIEMLRFCKELLRERALIIGRLDGRYTGCDRDSAGERFEFDPSFMEILGPYTAAINQYVREELRFQAEQPYEAVRPFNESWRWGEFQNRYASVSDVLRKAMAANPKMRVLVANGYYDLATPYFAADYALDHLEISPALRQNLSASYFHSGHMMYTHGPSLERLAGELRRFVSS